MTQPRASLQPEKENGPGPEQDTWTQADTDTCPHTDTQMTFVPTDAQHPQMPGAGARRCPAPPRFRL